MAAAKKFTNIILSECFSNTRRCNVWTFLSVSRNFNSMDTFKFSDLRIEIASQAQKFQKPDPSSLLFGESFSDHMFEVEWYRKSGWGTPRIIPIHNFQFHPGSKIFHYAQSAFEGMKAFYGPDGKVRLFRPDLNIKRLLATAERAALPTFDGDEFFKCLKKLVKTDREWIPKHGLSSLYIRPTFIGVQNSLGVQPSDKALLYIVTCPVGPYFPSGETKPISLLADPRYVRAWPGGVGDKKMSSNYAPSLYVQRLAQEQGLQQVLWLMGENHQIAEVGAMNVFFFLKTGERNFELVTPALDGTILPGVTRQSLLDLAKGFNEFQVSERSITMSEIVVASKDNRLMEMFVCGTACSVCPVNHIRYLNQDINIPTMSTLKPLYERLHTALTEIQYGKVESEWTVVVE